MLMGILVAVAGPAELECSEGAMAFTYQAGSEMRCGVNRIPAT